MTLVLTILVVALTVALVSLLTWEVVHRRSALVRAWHPSTFRGRVAGGLGMLEGGVVSDRRRPGAPEVVVLLHGLGATADYFGDLYEGLGNAHRLVMPDLLGFGRSLDETRAQFTLDDHVDAIDGALQSLGLGGSKVFVAAHSTGAAVALAWARRHADRATGVALWNPPVPDPADVDVAAELGEVAGGNVSRLLLADDEWAQRVCRFRCANRKVSGWLVASTAPQWPVDLSRRSALHSWEAFRGSLDSLVLDVDWPALFSIDVPVTVFRGVADPVGERDRFARVAPRAHVVDVDGADHHVPITHAHLLYDLLDA